MRAARVRQHRVRNQADNERWSEELTGILFPANPDPVHHCQFAPVLSREVALDSTQQRH